MVINDPTRFLVDPVTPEDDSQHGNVDLLAITNILSISGNINKICEDLIGWGPTTWASEAFAGDWESFHRCGTALGNLAKFADGTSANISDSLQKLDAWWQGHAAASAKEYFQTVAQALDAQQIALMAAMKEYHSMSFAVHLLAIQVQNLLEQAIDKLIIAGIAALAGTVLAETGVGAVVGYALAALQVTQALALINKASLLVQTATTTIVGGGATIAELAADLGELEAIALPANSYRHPALAGGPA